MKPLSRRTLLASSTIGSLSVAGCFGRETREEDEASTDDSDATADGERDGTDRESSAEGGAEETDDTADGDETDETDEIDEIVWRSEPGGHAVAVRDGVLYGLEDDVEGDGGVVALEAASGDRKWSYGKAGLLSGYTPPVVDDAIYFGLGDDAVGNGSGEFYALEFDGTERFTAETGSVYDPPRLADGTVFVGTDDGRVYAFDAEDGTERWAVKFGDDDVPLRTPTVEAVDDGVAYVTVGGTIRALDADDGTEQWLYDARDDWVSSITIDDGVYFETYDEIGVVDGGDERWTVTFDPSARIANIVEETVFVDRWDDLLALDSEDGTERWRDESETDRRIWMTDDAIYYRDDGSTTLRATDLEGDEQWTTALDGSEVRRIHPADDGVYAGTEVAVHRLDHAGEVVSTASLEDAGQLVVGDRVYTATYESFYALDL